MLLNLGLLKVYLLFAQYLANGLVSHISIRASQVETERVLTATADRSAHRSRALPCDRVARSVFLSVASYLILESYRPSNLKAGAGKPVEIAGDSGLSVRLLIIYATDLAPLGPPFS